MIGQTLGHYRIEEQLGAGGMGVVYKALDPRLNRTVAIKVLPARAVADPGRRERFVQEARAASALEHPNIVTIYEIDEVDGQYFIAMQYVAGKTLRQLLARGALPLSDLLRYAVQMADALARAHAKGIVHRDLKPDNVMVTAEGQVKILDFGLATLTDPLEPDEIPTGKMMAGAQAEEEFVLGTPSYMSPEQALGKKVGARSDIFSFGSLLYEMVTRRQPFRGENEFAVMTAIVREEPKKVSALAPSVPPELEKLISRAMRKDPERRWQSMADLRVTLMEIKEELEAGGVPTAKMPVGAVRKARTETREEPGPESSTESVPTPTKTPRLPQPQIKKPSESRKPAPGLQPPTGAPRERRFAWRLWGVVVLVIGVLVWFRLVRPGAKAPASSWTTIPFPTLEEGKFEPAFSPDGKQVAFVWGGKTGANFDIYVKPVDAGTPLQLTTDPAPDFSPTWSPDGRHIAFVRHSPAGGQILMVPARGGEERKLGQSAASWFGLAWSPDGKSVAILDRTSPQDGYSIFLLSIGTGEKRKVTSPPEDYFGDWRPTFSPDGKTLAFVRNRHFWAGDIYLLPVSAGKPKGEPRRLTSDNRLIWGLSWTPDSRSIVFSSSRGGKQGLWRISASGGALEPLAAAGVNAYSPAVSLQGGYLAYTRSAWDTNIWRIDGPGSTGGGSLPVKLISSPKPDVGPQFSPDGKKIAFASARSGSWEIWFCNQDGSNPVQLTSFGGPYTGSPRWSPDGRFLAFDSRREGNADIFVISAEGGRARRLTTERSDDVWPSWSRDGGWIYFASNRSGQWEVWKAPAQGGPNVHVTWKGGYEAFESPDGKFVYYAKLDVPGIWRVPVEGGEETQVLDQGDQGFWGVLNQGIYFFNLKATPRPAFQFFGFTARQLKPIPARPNELPLFTSGEPPAVTVSPDGRWILYVQLDHTESDIALVGNFR